MTGLFGSTTVEVALGLFFVFWLLSLVCSTIQETVASWSKWRAKDLENGVLSLLCDPGLSARVLNHPLIAALGNADAEIGVVQRLADGTRRNPITFTGNLIALFIRSLTAWKDKSKQARAGNISYSVTWELHRFFAAKPSYIPSRTFSTALFDSLVPSTGPALTVESLKQRANQLATMTLTAPTDVQDLRDIVTALTSHVRELGVLASDAAGRAAPLDGPRDAFDRLMLKAGGTVPTTIEQLRGVIVGAFPTASATIDAHLAELIAAKQTIGRSILATIEQSRNPAGLFEQVQQVKAIADAHPTNPLTEPDKAEMIAALAPARTIADLRRFLALVPPGNALRTKMDAAVKALEVQADTAEINLQTVRENFEQWFDYSMDRVTGIYKRRAQTLVLFLALLLTLCLGADSIRIARLLAANSTLRASIVNEASAAVQAAAASLTVTPRPTVTPTPTATATPPAAAANATGAAGLAATETPTPIPTLPARPSSEQIMADLNLVQDLFGYDDLWKPALPASANVPWWQYGAWWNAFAPRLLTKAIGIALTTFAVSLGAPFWFDLLTKLVNVRATGPTPEQRDQKQQAQSQGSS